MSTDSNTPVDMTPEEAEQLSENITVETPDGEVPLSSVMVDILIAHEDLNDYKEAAISMEQCLKERRLKAQERGNDDAVELIQELEDSARGIYLRLQRGDAELTGERDGEFSGFFETEDDDATN